MQLKELRINKLFGHFNHRIPLNNEEKITIITGPNGYGKTMILDIVNAVFKGDFNFISRVEFAEVYLIFAGKYLLIRQIESQVLEIELVRGEPDDKVSSAVVLHSIVVGRQAERDELPERQLNRIADIVPQLRRVTPNRWYESRTGRRMSLAEVMDRYPKVRAYIGTKSVKLDDWLDTIVSAINVHIVKDQRLLRRADMGRDVYNGGERLPIDTIEQYADELRAELTHCKIKYDTKARELDASLPSRWFAKPFATTIFDSAELSDQIETLKANHERLKKHGVLTEVDPFNLEMAEIPAEDRKFLSLYVQDHAEKLKIYQRILSRIELFTTILNNKGLAFKQVKVNPHDGFVFISDAGKPLKLTQLSSGEQHQVVLVYELIFKAKDNDLVLIDEPEISLHIAWQKEFLGDIQRIIDMQNVSVIIATHSPQIIDIHWNLTVDLEEE
ncbi:MAG: ABC-type lipoprotein export system ATPase subunit [Phenylobacterium sp.]|jgi:ABC-type lipoprotein export system ATPase subunit